jgi:6-phosphogluconolactonase
MQLHVYKNPEELSEAVAGWMADYITEVLTKKPRFTLALSGGSTPKKLHAVLASAPYSEMIAWENVHIFWGDERAVPFTDERNNARMAFDTLLDLVPVPERQIHVMRTDIPPAEAARQYDAILHEYFDETSTSFDLVLLGMGDDGHTLSLFPGQEVINEKTTWCTAFFLDAQDMYRITLTAPIVNRSAAVAFLTTGSSKSATLKQVLQGERNVTMYPSQIIQPEQGELHWFVDEAAASDLSRNSDR